MRVSLNKTIDEIMNSLTRNCCVNRLVMVMIALSPGCSHSAIVISSNCLSGLLHYLYKIVRCIEDLLNVWRHSPKILVSVKEEINVRNIIWYQICTLCERQ